MSVFFSITQTLGIFEAKWKYKGVTLFENTHWFGFLHRKLQKRGKENSEKKKRDETTKRESEYDFSCGPLNVPMTICVF